MCEICNGANLEGIDYLNCSNCPLLTNIPNIIGLKTLYCWNCPILTIIPNIKGLIDLYCDNCPLLNNILNIKELKNLQCSDCPLLTNIYNNGQLRKLYCDNCPLLNYIPNISRLIAPALYEIHLFKLPFKGCKYLVSAKVENLYNNIYYLWKKYQFKKYIMYLVIKYSNPELSYMKYYIENELYSENKDKLRIGYMNSKKELIWYKCN